MMSDARTDRPQRGLWFWSAVVALLLVTSAGLFALMPLSAEIRGRVIDAETGQPLSDARVSITPHYGPTPVQTDARGAFVFTRLAARSYWISAGKSGFVDNSYPKASGTFRPTALTLSDGETKNDVTIALTRAGTLAGRVLDERGQPLGGVAVGLLRFEQRDGRRTVVGSSGGRLTDADGAFSTHDLPPGLYGLAFDLASRRIVLRPGQPIESEEFGYDPTYYPGVATIDEATSISLAPGQQVTNLDIRLTRVARTAVSGRVTRSDGAPVGQLAAIQIYSRRNATMSGGHSVRLQDDGTFQTRLVPGEYQITAGLAAKPADPPFEPRLAHGIWDEGTTRITVGATPVTDIALVTTPGSVLAGRVRFEGKSPLPPPQMNSFHLFMPTFSGDQDRMCRGGYGSELRAADLTFTMVNLRGLCDATTLPVLTGPWRLKSIRLAGVNLMGQRIDFDVPRNWRDVEVVLTDRHPTLLVHVTDERGDELLDYVTLAFSVDATRWSNTYFVRPFASPVHRGHPPVRRAMVLRASGQIVGDLPAMPELRSGYVDLMPGDYYVVALDELALRDMSDPAFLQRLIPLATRVRLGEDDVQTVRLSQLKHLSSTLSAAP